MVTPGQNGLITSSLQTQGNSAVKTLMQNLSAPNQGISRVLAQALTNGSLRPAQSSGALSTDQVLIGIIGGVPPYSSDAHLQVARDFTTVYTGTADTRLEALNRLTASFCVARQVFVDAISASSGKLDPELQQTATHFNAGYVLLIATVHSIIGTAPDNTKQQLFSAFTELLDADPCLSGLITCFSDVRNSVHEGARKVAVRGLFNKFCSEATHPTIYGETVSAVVQSMLIRELKQVLALETRQEARYLAPYLAGLFEEKMRSEVDTARNRDQKPQPVLQALRRCSSEANDLMEAVVVFLLEGGSLSAAGTHNPATACEVMLSVGCLLPGTRLVSRLQDLLQVDDLQSHLALLFLSALKFSCHLEDPDQRVDAGYVVKFGIWLLPQLTDEQKTRMIRDVFAPLHDNFVDYLASSPDTLLTMGTDLREQCIQEVLAPRLEREGRAVAREINPTADRTVATALLTHLAPPASIDLDTSGSATAASGTDDEPTCDDEQTAPVPRLPDVCLRWLVQNSEGCGVSPELCTVLVRHILEQAGGFDSLGLDAGTANTLLRLGGFPTLRLLAERQSEKERLAKLLGEYVPISDLECAVIQGVFKDQFIGDLRKLINIRASTIDSRVKLEQAKMGLQEKVDATAIERRRAGILSQQTVVLTAFLNDHTPYIKAERDLVEARQKLAAAESDAEGVKKLTRREIIEQKKAGARDRLANEIETLNATIQEITEIKFKLLPAVAKELIDWKSSEIIFGQYHAMQDTLRTVQINLGKADSAFKEIQVEVDGLDSEITSITQQILSLYPLVRYACQSSALNDLDPSQFSLQDKDTGTTDLVGVMCKVNLVLARQNAQAMEATSKDLNKALLIGLGKDISLALQNAFRDGAQKPQSLAVLTDLADLAGASCPLLSAWEECDSSKSGVHYTSQSLQKEVSLLELLYRNIRFDLRQDAISWGLPGRAGWDESFHGPVIRLFASLTRHDNVGMPLRQRSLAVAMDGITAEVVRYEEAAKALAEDAALPVSERRPVPSNLVPIHDLLRGWTDVLRATSGVPTGSDQFKEQKKQHIRSITEQLAVRANELLAAASEAELDCCFIPAGKVLVRLNKDHKSALSTLPDGCIPFLVSLKAAIDCRKLAGEQAAVPPPNEGSSSRVSGLEYSADLFRSLTLSQSQKIQSRLGAGNAQ